MTKKIKNLTTVINNIKDLEVIQLKNTRKLYNIVKSF